MLRKYFGIDWYYLFAFLTWNAIATAPFFSAQNAHFKPAYTKINLFSAMSNLYRMTWNFVYELFWSFCTLCEMPRQKYVLDLVYRTLISQWCGQKMANSYFLWPYYVTIVWGLSILALKDSFQVIGGENVFITRSATRPWSRDLVLTLKLFPGVTS